MNESAKCENEKFVRISPPNWNIDCPQSSSSSSTSGEGYRFAAKSLSSSSKSESMVSSSSQSWHEVILISLSNGGTLMRWWAWYRGRTQYPSIFAFLVFPLWRWLTMMHGTDVTLHTSCVSPCDHVRTQCSIFVKSLLLTAPLFGNV